MSHLTDQDKAKFILYLEEEMKAAEEFVAAAQHLPENIRNIYTESKKHFITCCQRVRQHLEMSESMTL